VSQIRLARASGIDILLRFALARTVKKRAVARVRSSSVATEESVGGDAEEATDDEEDGVEA
jgi:hypothetical protein